MNNWRIILFFFIVKWVPSFAQNLVQNPSFEEHLPINGATYDIRDDNFTTTMKGWRILNSPTHICECNQKIMTDGLRSRICSHDNVKAHKGCTMMELQYMPNCPNQEMNTRGCASYLGTKLAAPLELGKVYEVSFWLNIQPPGVVDYPQHIGFALYPDIIRKPPNYTLEGSSFLIDTVMIDQWYQVKWLVRPICNLQFLLFGVFKNAEGPAYHFDDLWEDVYYIDDVMIREVKDGEMEGVAIIPHCKYKPEESDFSVEIPGASCYFETGDSTLTEVAKIELDSFALRAKVNPKTAFLITGHTDSIGENHQQLSAARVEAVLQYLEEKHRIPRIRFARYGRGASEPAATNSTAVGRHQNRRVSITQMDLDIDMVIYRHLLEAVFDEKKEEAYKTLNTWLLIAPDRKKISVLNDPRLAILKNDQRWNAVYKKIKSSYAQYKKPEIAFQLDSLWAEDQKPRTLPYYIENMNSYYAQIDSTDKRWDVDFPNEKNHVSENDEAHFALLNKIMDKYGWPKSSEVGERAAKAAFLIVDHHLDTTTLAHFIPIVEARCMEGEAEWIYYATMYDRLQILLNNPQRYGTQYKVLDNAGEKLELYPLEDKLQVNAWRQRFGLSPITQ
ncbi:MAG: OmpA family protein [Bacteroidetes bacterium]|nr:OmpA family protein [Bacteroidota bacterium]